VVAPATHRRVRDPSDVKRVGVVAREMQAGAAGVARKPERPDEVAAASRRHHAQDRVGRHRRPLPVEHPVDDLVNRPISAHGDDVSPAPVERLAREPRGVAPPLGPEQAVRQAAGAQGALELGDLLANVPLAGVRVHDHRQLAEGRRHG